MIDERPKILVSVRALLESEFPIVMPGHHRHILQMTRTSFIADRAIMRMVCHQPPNNLFAESLRIVISNRDVLLIGDRFHTRHHQSSFLIVFVFVNFDGTLSTCADRSERRVPAEVRQIESQGKARLQ
jgi:hypothetical protein